MLHWPDSMFSYLVEEQVLFSQDAFGMHLATSERFDNQVDVSILGYEAATYYANIILPYSSLVLKLLDKVELKQPIYATPVAANGTLYIAARSTLFAFAKP